MSTSAPTRSSSTPTSSAATSRWRSRRWGPTWRGRASVAALRWPRSPPGSVSSGLVVSFSITSFAALLAGLGIVALLRWGWRGAAVPPPSASRASRASPSPAERRRATSRTTARSTAGASRCSRAASQLFEDKPAAGWGSGAFGQAFYEEIEQARSTISHSEPVTVAAEQGVIGLAVYVALPDHGPDRAVRPRPRVAPPRYRRRMLRRGARPQPRVRGLRDRPRDVGPARPRRGAARPRSARRIRSRVPPSAAR